MIKNFRNITVSTETAQSQLSRTFYTNKLYVSTIDFPIFSPTVQRFSL